jgi:hypothetical protein
MQRRSAVRFVALAGFILALAGSAWANGEEFFALPKDGTVDLVYFGRIKDSRTGRSVSGSVYFLLTDKSSGLSFQFLSDKPGHYRSPDVGTAIKGIGEDVKVDAFELTTIVEGYKNARITRLPRKSHGTVELEVRLDPIASSDVSTAGLGATDAPQYAWIIALAALALWLLYKGARPFSRPRSAEH